MDENRCKVAENFCRKNYDPAFFFYNSLIMQEKEAAPKVLHTLVKVDKYAFGKQEDYLLKYPAINK